MSSTAEPALQAARLAVNTLTGQTYPHHPVVLQADLGPFAVDPLYLVEWNGLSVPAQYDCDMFNGGESWGLHHYFKSVPSRWTLCWQLYGAIRSGMLTASPPLPVIDEEYTELVATWHAVLRRTRSNARMAGDRFVFMELGARWGTWSARAIALLRVARPWLQYQLYLVESSKMQSGRADSNLPQHEHSTSQACLMS